MLVKFIGSSFSLMCVYSVERRYLSTYCGLQINYELWIFTLLAPIVLQATWR